MIDLSVAYISFAVNVGGGVYSRVVLDQVYPVCIYRSPNYNAFYRTIPGPLSPPYNLCIFPVSCALERGHGFEARS